MTIAKRLFALTLILSLFMGTATLAQNTPNNTNGNTAPINQSPFNAHAIKNQAREAVAKSLSTKETTVSAVVARVIQQALTLIGIILIVIIIYAGFLWLTAGGNAEQVKKAKTWIINAVIGMILIFAAYAITGFIIDLAVGKTTG